MPLVMGADKPSMLRILLLSGHADITKANGALEEAYFRSCIESIPILLDAGAPINGGPDDYHRPLYTAVRENETAIVALLLSRGANTNQEGMFARFDGVHANCHQVEMDFPYKSPPPSQ